MVAKKFMYACGLICLVHSLGGCPAQPPVVPPVPDASDASVAAIADSGEDMDGASATCSNACANLKKLGCPEANTLPGGDTCVVLCQKTQASGKFDMKPSCVSKAKDVAGLKACGTVRCK
jgi:hypothetical protein